MSANCNNIIVLHDDTLQTHTKKLPYEQHLNKQSKELEGFALVKKLGFYVKKKIKFKLMKENFSFIKSISKVLNYNYKVLPLNLWAI